MTGGREARAGFIFAHMTGGWGRLVHLSCHETYWGHQRQNTEFLHALTSDRVTVCRYIKLRQIVKVLIQTVNFSSFPNTSYLLIAIIEIFIFCKDSLRALQITANILKYLQKLQFDDHNLFIDFWLIHLFRPRLCPVQSELVVICLFL